MSGLHQLEVLLGKPLEALQLLLGITLHYITLHASMKMHNIHRLGASAFGMRCCEAPKGQCCCPLRL